MAKANPTTSELIGSRNYRGKMREARSSKLCTGCQQEKPLAEFTFSKTERRHKCHCHTCRHEAYVRDRERAIVRASLHYRANRESVLEKMRQRRHSNIAGELLKHARQRARHKRLTFSLSAQDILVPELCPVFGVPLAIGNGRVTPNSPTLDRIDSTKGYVPGNVIVVSQRANTIKSDATPCELRQVASFYERLVTWSDQNAMELRP